MERRFAHTSSLARKFFCDFPDFPDERMPLDLLPAAQQEAFASLVLPLLQADLTTTAACCEAARTLLPVFSQPGGGADAYSAARGVADYLQAPLALCVLDTAAAFSLLPGCAPIWRVEPEAAGELLTEDLRRRLVANGLGSSVTGCVHLRLDDHPALAAATPAPGDADRLLLPVTAAYRCSQPQCGADAAALYRPFQQLAAAAAAGPAAGPLLLKRAAWRRQLSRACSHYLAPLLGRDAGGCVLLTGSPLASATKGLGQQHAAAGASALGSSHTLAFVGYADAAAAQAALEGCMTEVLTRYRMRHPAPVTDAAGSPVQPLAVATRQHLVLLLPEPTQAQLPAAVGLDAAALQDAAAAGAWAGPAAAAAAGADPAAAAADPAAVAAGAAAAQGAAAPVAHPEQQPAAGGGGGCAADGAAAAGSSTFRDITLCFDLALHPSLEALLLAAPNPLAALAFDGDDMFTLPSAVRAVVSGALLLEPAAVARGHWCSDSGGGAAAELAAEASGAELASATAGGAGQGGGASSSAAGLLAACALDRERVAAAVQDVQQAAAQGWQPLLLLPDGAVPPSAGSLLQQLQLHAADVPRRQGHESGASLVAAAGLQPSALRQLLATGGPGRAQLEAQEGWVWGDVSGGTLPPPVAAAVAGWWWRGPVMRGSHLLHDEEGL